MGADLCLEYAFIKKSKKPDWKKGQALLKSIEKKWKEEIKENGEDYELDESLFGYPITPAEALKQLKSDFIEFKAGVIKNQRRDFSPISVGDYRVWITGGMTWGDDPSDMYGIINRLNSAGITEACGFK